MKKFETRDMILISMFAAIIVVLSFVKIDLPFTPVPLTGQTLAIMLVGLLLTPRQAFFSVFIWIMLGVVGIPVFSGGRAGIGVIFGTSGGYIVGFLVAAVFISYFKGSENNIVKSFIIAFIGGIIIIYVLGSLWLAYVASIPLSVAVAKGVIPFVVGDIIKLVVAVLLSYELKKRIQFNY